MISRESNLTMLNKRQYLFRMFKKKTFISINKNFSHNNFRKAEKITKTKSLSD